MKQAVILIHGIGEQYPMDTIRGFVDTMWYENTDLHADHPNANKYFVSPDDYLENFDLRRITSSNNKFGVRTVFYEYYWAHLMQGNKMAHVLKWLKRIINPFKLPSPLNIASILLLTITIGLAVFFYWFKNTLNINSSLFLIGKLLIIPAVISIVVGLLEKFVGDAARYLDPSPPNVHVRQKIRKEGVQMLMKLKEKGYEKIIIVGHSLGSVIAYDIVRYAWTSLNISYKSGTKLTALKKVVDHINKTDLCDNVDAYQDRQWEAFKEQKEKNGNWLVSDLITIGSPLTYSQIFLAKNVDEFNRLKKQREILTSPPDLDNGKLTYTSKKESRRKMISSSAFALTRWTNIYSPSKFLIFGDIISGPISKLFGDTINDIGLDKPKFFDHTKYWKNSKSSDRVNVVRKSLKLDELKSDEYLKDLESS